MVRPVLARIVCSRNTRRAQPVNVSQMTTAHSIESPTRCAPSRPAMTNSAMPSKRPGPRVREAEDWVAQLKAAAARGVPRPIARQSAVPRNRSCVVGVEPEKAADDLRPGRRGDSYPLPTGDRRRPNREAAPESRQGRRRPYDSQGPCTQDRDDELRRAPRHIRLGRR
jgi:hypothetical protein